MTLSDSCERGRRVGKSDLIVDGVVSFARRISLHRRATIEHPARHLRFNRKHVQACVTLSAASNEGVNDCPRVNHGRESRRRENDLEFVADADNSRASDCGTFGTDHGIYQQVSDVVTVGDSYREPQPRSSPQPREKRASRVIIARFDRSREPRRPAEPRDSVSRGEGRREHHEMTKAETLLGDPAGKFTLHLCEPAYWPCLHALVICDLRTMAVEVADDADELCRAVETEEPLHHG